MVDIIFPGDQVVTPEGEESSGTEAGYLVFDSIHDPHDLVPPMIGDEIIDLRMIYADEVPNWVDRTVRPDEAVWRQFVRDEIKGITRVILDFEGFTTATLIPEFTWMVQVLREEAPDVKVGRYAGNGADPGTSWNNAKSQWEWHLQKVAGFNGVWDFTCVTIYYAPQANSQYESAADYEIRMDYRLALEKRYDNLPLYVITSMTPTDDGAALIPDDAIYAMQRILARWADGHVVWMRKKTAGLPAIPTGIWQTVLGGDPNDA